MMNLKNKLNQLRQNAVDNIGFIKYLYKERVRFYKLYRFEKEESEGVNKVVQFLNATDAEIRRTRNSTLRQETQRVFGESGYKYVGDFKRQWVGSGPAPQYMRDHEENKIPKEAATQ